MTTEDTAPLTGDDLAGGLAANAARRLADAVRRLTEADQGSHFATLSAAESATVLRALRKAEKATAERDRVTGLLDHATRFEFSDLPEDDIDRIVWSVTAEYHGEGRWAVMWMGRVLCADDRWEYTGTTPSNKGERYDRDTAIRLAGEWAGKVAYRGLTAAGVLAKQTEREAQ